MCVLADKRTYLFKTNVTLKQKYVSLPHFPRLIKCKTYLFYSYRCITAMPNRINHAIFPPYIVLRISLLI